MKKISFSILLVSLVFFFPGCSKFTEITPKGKNTLSSVSDLDLVLNFDYSTNTSVIAGGELAKITAESAFKFDELNLLIDDLYPYVTNVSTLVNAPSKTLNYVLFTSNETLDRTSLVATDIKYEKMYFIIDNVCNVVLAKADEASGDRVKAKQLKAEAYILRAYFHYWLVNIYAKAYNPSTAAKDGGIPYVKENNLISEPNKKSTVAEVYDNILADIDAALQLNSLPVTPINNMRAGLAFAYAVKARVMLSMRNYAGALEAANASLDINNYLEDHRVYSPVGTAAFTKAPVSAADNLFYAGAGTTPIFSAPSLEILNNYYEAGSIFNDYIKPYYSYPGIGELTLGIPNSQLFYNPSAYAINTAGLTTEDMYFTKAECLARTNKVSNAMDTLNLIRQMRIHPSVYTPLSASSEAQAMAYLKKMSRTEFLYTGKNFLNIKRWNTEEAYKETISRTVPITTNGVTTTVTYQLSPESPLWIFPFPQSATNYNSNLTQNY
ncbi:hypothetical protein HNQ91_000735 [Filimonas zeae]|uniref:SusD family protein n=1 Tax=Filimonas zeae TaxID=1737353 RepID=A0A917MTL8_9BACT|nr:RagB/SusD family nutrient uptake outer membrane protein [Filimonas zeae]MDR6337713.1 hypothetical protein [Filimonas zeae]GGH59906.1 hypothetical protein GCM10011379_07200 [Filimonas zeae]